MRFRIDLEKKSAVYVVNIQGGGKIVHVVFENLSGEEGRSNVSPPHHPISLKDNVTVILLLGMHLNGLFRRDRVESCRKSIRKTKNYQPI